MEPRPLTEDEATIRGRLLLWLEESKAHIATTETTSPAHYFWTLTHEVRLDELRAFDRCEGLWWNICQPGPLPPDEPDAALP